MSPTGQTRAFTLVECIVVMLTTIMLASIVIPALFLGKANEEPIEFELKPLYEDENREDDPGTSGVLSTLREPASDSSAVL